MKRRKALELTASIFGTAIIGSDVFLSGCSRQKDHIPFDASDVRFLDEIGETILPATDRSPGAKAAHIGDFMKTIVEDCYSGPEYKLFIDGMKTIRKASKKRYDQSFEALDSKERLSLLRDFDKKAQNAGDDHFFTMIKQLTIWGYFTSEPGATKALRYNPIPGRYDGCVPYEKGDTAWA